MKKAKAYMEKTGASFIVTGEVLGERPMSQRRDAMRLIEKEAALEGFILRPLSAKLLPPSIPEKEGWIDRDRLLNIQGRSRKPQMELAALFGIQDYPCPAGGCLLTDPGFAKRIKDLITHDPDFTLNDVHLLKMGRHFRMSPAVKLIVGRNEEENLKIQTFSQEGDILLQVSHYPGPVSLLRGAVNGKEIEKAAAITARYSKAKELREVEVVWRKAKEEEGQSIQVSPIQEGEIKGLMIGV
jgi:tRNA U34 2-thiouridine synthase MnmA/TrmU